MRAAGWLLISMLCATGAACDDAATPEASTASSPAHAQAPQAATPTALATPTLPPGGKVQRIGVWQPPAGLEQAPIWPGAAPDMAGVSWPAESVLTADTPEALAGRTSQAVFDVSVPTMTVFPPKGRNTGAAVIVFPGGGFRILAVTVEGTEICDWITAQGMTCILSKYRVPKTAHHWDPDCRCAVTPKVPRALQDAQRTIRLVRARAKALGVDPDRIGVMGFSAGGYLAVQTSNVFAPAYAPVDAIDRISSRPDFAVVFYPGHICRRGTTFDPGLHVSERTSPTFLLQAWDDPVDDLCNSTLYARALDDAGVPSEVHLFAKGGHAFGLRGTGRAVSSWPTLLATWLRERGVLGDTAARR